MHLISYRKFLEASSPRGCCRVNPNILLIEFVDTVEWERRKKLANYVYFLTITTVEKKSWLFEQSI